ncbi:MAG: futalosine hydrolase [Chitinophagales bacterium]
MKYLIVSATHLEIQPLLNQLKVKNLMEGIPQTFSSGKLEITILITGVGMMATAFHLGRILTKQTFDGVINVGIAGAFDRSLSLGELVVVNRQQYGDLGVSAPNQFEDIYEMGLIDKDAHPFKNGKIYNNKSKISLNPAFKKVRAISVNTISGKTDEIKAIEKKYSPQIEVMEGIAVHYACKQSTVEYEELRAISNYVEERNKANWNMALAIKNLNDFLMDWFK